MSDPVTTVGFILDKGITGALALAVFVLWRELKEARTSRDLLYEARLKDARENTATLLDQAENVIRVNERLTDLFDDPRKTNEPRPRQGSRP